MKLKILVVGLLTCCSAQAKTYEFSNGMQFDISGYLGWKQIISDVEFDSVPSQPEIGVTTSLKVTDTINIYNQFRYDTNLDSIFVYNQINYTPKIPINDFTLTLKGGKIWYDWGLYNKTRVNPRTRQGVFQPQAMYWNTLDQTITSGVGVGVDVKYKNFSVSYMIDKTTIGDPNETAKAWLLLNTAQDLTAEFGDHQMVSTQYEMPDYGLRFTGFWSTFDFKARNTPFTQPVQYGGAHLGVGAEWVHNDFTTSFEGMCVKRAEWSWAPFSRLYCGLSSTVEYDITDNISVRANYNQYRTPFPPANQIQTYTKDMNLGFGWHSGPWMANVEAHYIQGGRLVEPTNFIANPNDYKNFYVVGMNLVYFFD